METNSTQKKTNHTFNMEKIFSLLTTGKKLRNLDISEVLTTITDQMKIQHCNSKIMQKTQH